MSIPEHQSDEFDLSTTGAKAWWDVPIGKPIQIYLDGAAAVVDIEGRTQLADGTWTNAFSVPKDADGAAATYTCTANPALAVYLNPVYREKVQLRMNCTTLGSGDVGRFLA